MKGRKRQLRYKSSCSPIQNIFRDQKYILHSGSHFLPEDIYIKLNKFQTITCDQINSLTFVRNEPHEHNLTRMVQAYNQQHKMIVERSEGMRMIKSEENEYDGQQQILNNPCFKSDLQNLFIP